MYLFFDTETTGLPNNWRAPVTDLSNWPRVVQLAWLLYDDDGNSVGGQTAIIKPSGFNIPPSASMVHGITTDRAMREGKELGEVLDSFYMHLENCHTLVAHNISFDEKVLGAEFLRCRYQNLLPTKRQLCTMLGTVNYCRIPGNYGYKWPKLSELHAKLFGSHFEEAHNAEADIKATARCFWELRRQRMI